MTTFLARRKVLHSLCFRLQERPPFQSRTGRAIPPAIQVLHDGKLADRVQNRFALEGHSSCDEWYPVSESSAACNPSADTGRARIWVAQGGRASRIMQPPPAVVC